MATRRLLILVDAEDILCGDCTHVETTESNKKWCVVFLRPLAIMQQKAGDDWQPVRTQECKEAEFRWKP